MTTQACETENIPDADLGISPASFCRQVGKYYHLAFASDLGADRFGIVTVSMDLMSPNAILPVAARYLLKHRSAWPADAAIGKTMFCSHLMDRVANRLRRRPCDLPPSFHGMAPLLFDGEIGFGGDVTSGATFLRHDRHGVDLRSMEQWRDCELPRRTRS